MYTTFYICHGHMHTNKNFPIPIFTSWYRSTFIDMVLDTTLPGCCLFFQLIFHFLLFQCIRSDKSIRIDTLICYMMLETQNSTESFRFPFPVYHIFFLLVFD